MKICIYTCDVCGMDVTGEHLGDLSWCPPKEIEHVCKACVERMEQMLGTFIADERAKWLAKKE